MKKLRSLFLTLFICGLLFIPVSVASAFSGPGSGTEADPYLISTPEQLNEVRDGLDAHYQLANDITLSGNWIPINKFNGELNGNNKAINNLSITGDLDSQGLINELHGTVKNLKINNVNLKLKRNAGALANKVMATGKVENVDVSGVIESSGASVGGLINISYGEIKNCSANVDITTGDSSSGAGGLVASNYNLIENSYATGNITINQISAGIAGGLVGASYEGTIKQSYATGNIVITGGNTGGQYNGAGGLVGCNNATSQIENCFALGDVSTEILNRVGGLVGVNYGTINKSYSAGKVSAPDIVGGLVGDFTQIKQLILTGI